MTDPAAVRDQLRELLADLASSRARVRRLLDDAVPPPGSHASAWQATGKALDARLARYAEMLGEALEQGSDEEVRLLATLVVQVTRERQDAVAGMVAGMELRRLHGFPAGGAAPGGK
jgi:hypothetical protein